MCEVPNAMNQIEDPEPQESGEFKQLLDALHAALRWIDSDYRNHINNDGAYQIMMDDKYVGESYKDDITLIRSVIKA